MRVAIHYHASDNGARETARLVAEAGGTPWVVAADLTSDVAPNDLLTAVIEEFGSLDVLVSSSAVMERTPLGEVTVAQRDAVMAVNLRAPFLLGQAAAPHWQRS